MLRAKLHNMEDDEKKIEQSHTLNLKEKMHGAVLVINWIRAMIPTQEQTFNRLYMFI